MKIHQLHPSLRPREKALRNGIDSLSDRELLALLIRCGSKSSSALDIADVLLNGEGSLSGLHDYTLADLIKIRGINQVKALEIIAMLEFAKRSYRPRHQELVDVQNLVSLSRWFNGLIGYESQENLVVVALNHHGHYLGHKKVFVGTLTQALVHPRDILNYCFQNNSNRVILVHNHPSGNLTPSEEDIKMTLITKKALNTVSIELEDHFIVGSGKCVSIRALFPKVFMSNQ